ncbi:MAG TPA: S8 family serine peptidase, partial [Gemmataceae bacterium]|nr:S8 family serine peptidase [Gemmataceae bacterium]
MDNDDRAYHERTARYFQLIKDLQQLKSVRVVGSGLVWNDGHPADTTSALTRYFDEQPFQSALWFQAAGDARGQAWSGLFRDEDRAGVMAFDSAAASPNDNPWARQLDFLAWAPDGGKTTRDLPADTQARISVQWREAHDPTAGRPGEDPYRKPLADLHIVVLYQPDPSGAMQPADDLDVVVQSVGPPQRLEATPSSAVYEQTVLLQVAKPGRYAVRIEGTAPTGTRPRSDPSVPAAITTFELHPRLFVETLKGPGRVLLHDFVTDAGTLGTPADSRAVLTVGAADRRGLPQPYSAGGPPHDVALLAKPDVLAYDQVGDGAQGTGVATGFAAGIAAAARGMGSANAVAWLESMGVEPGGVVHAPK